MSYDLFFFRDKSLTRDEFTSFFVGRENYRSTNYGNEDTGVYFSFAYQEAEEEEEGEELRVPAATFNLNYVRPHYFGLEAGPEVQAVIHRFGFTIEDPQRMGMGNGPFRIDGFLSGWNAGNEFAYQATIGRGAGDPHRRPAAELESIWRWNYRRQRLQARLGLGVFVPRVVWLALGGRVQSAVVWGDAVPAVIPKVDLLYVIRKELAPAGDDHAIIPYQQFVEALGEDASSDFGLPCHVLTGPEPSPRIRQFVQRLQPDSRQPEFVPMDAVLDEELVHRSSK